MTPPTKLSKDIVSQLEDKKIAPKPRWHFLLKNYVMWVVGGISVIIGGAAVSVMIYMLQHNDWDLFKDAENGASFIISTLPYFWVIILALMIGAALYNVKHTKTGYKYHAYTVVLGSIVLSGLLGGILYAAGAGKAIDRVLEEEVSIYSELFVRKAHHLTKPEDGRLAGVITAVDTYAFMIVDINGIEWTVDMENLQAADEVPEEGRIVLIRGTQTGSSVFSAEAIKLRGPDEPFGHKDKLPKGPFGKKFLDKDGNHKGDKSHSEDSTTQHR